MVYKLVSKLAIQVLATNILDSKLVSKRLIETNLEYKVVTLQEIIKYKSILETKNH